jgi:hypothetical protein
MKRKLLQHRTFFVTHLLVKLHSGLTFLVIMSLLTSCVSAKYKMASEDTPPPVLLNLETEAHSVNAMINTVIIFGGPGSWKREAYWDEYLLSITNHGDHPVTLTSSMLIDFQDNQVMSGNDPWELQEQSKEWIKKYDPGTTGVLLKVGAASLLPGAVLGSIAMAATSSSAMFSPAVVGASVAIAVTVVALPIVGFGSILANVSKKHKIQDEFNRRRLVLPVAIQSGQMIQGSLFFRITPGPRRLSLLFAEPKPDFDVSVDLALLSDLHIDRNPGEKPPDRGEHDIQNPP